MAKAAGGLPFPLKTAQPFGVAAHFRRQNFDRHAIAQQNVARAIDGAHTAFTQQRFDLVLAIEGFTDKRAGILFQDLAVLGTKTYGVVEFFVTE
jgi:hypothetical protein